MLSKTTSKLWANKEFNWIFKYFCFQFYFWRDSLLLSKINRKDLLIKILFTFQIFFHKNRNHKIFEAKKLFSLLILQCIFWKGVFWLLYKGHVYYLDKNIGSVFTFFSSPIPGLLSEVLSLLFLFLALNCMLGQAQHYRQCVSSIRLVLYWLPNGHFPLTVFGHQVYFFF